MERELANVIYIFVSPNEQGIKFYDRSPDGAVAKFAGSLPEGKFQTDSQSISYATWDDEINEENKSQMIKTYGGTYTATTIMVSPEQMEYIIDTILDSKDKSRIIIDVFPDKNTLDNAKRRNIEELEYLKKLYTETLETLPTVENLFSSDTDNDITNKNIKK